MGVTSPRGCACVDDEGVVGFVDSASSDIGRLVAGVSGRGTGSVTGWSGTGAATSSFFSVSTSGSASAPCDMFGSSTDSAIVCGGAFRFRLAFLAGHGSSGIESHGKGALKGGGGVNSWTGTPGENGTTAAVIVGCGAGGVIGTGMVYVDFVDDGA